MRKIITAVVVTLALMGGAADTADARPLRGEKVCTEDMACWNCHTMGNRICGPGHRPRR